MKYLILLSISLFLIPLSAYGQEESISELSERLDKENLEKAQQIQQGQQPQSSFEKVDCLPWQTEKALSGGGIECVDTGEGISADSGLYIVIGVIIFIIIIGIIVKASRKSESRSYKDVVRSDFTFTTKERVKELQKGKCAICDRYPTHWEFDHIDTRGDNSIENCQGLCRDCHQKKTLDDNWKNTRN